MISRQGRRPRGGRSRFAPPRALPLPPVTKKGPPRVKPRKRRSKLLGVDKHGYSCRLTIEKHMEISRCRVRTQRHASFSQHSQLQPKDLLRFEHLGSNMRNCRGMDFWCGMVERVWHGLSSPDLKVMLSGCFPRREILDLNLSNHTPNPASQRR